MERLRTWYQQGVDVGVTVVAEPPDSRPSISALFIIPLVGENKAPGSEFPGALFYQQKRSLNVMDDAVFHQRPHKKSRFLFLNFRVRSQLRGSLPEAPRRATPELLPPASNIFSVTLRTYWTVSLPSPSLKEVPFRRRKPGSPPHPPNRGEDMTTLKIIWNRRQKIPCLWFLVLLLSFGYPQPSRAGSASDTFSNSLDSPSEDSPNLLSAVGDYFRDWSNRVDETQAVQPHWKPPLITTSPILTELYKYDQYWEHLSNGAGNLTNFDTGKGFELIPAKPIEVIIGLPPYEERSGKNPAVGLGDWPFLLLKYRLFSANEENGNYCLTPTVAFTAPTGSNAFSTKNFGITPNIASGKGWGDFDVLLDFGANLPTGDFNKLGTPLLTNVTFQYKLLNVLWPQLEVNYTYWPNGPNRGKNQVFLLPGMAPWAYPAVQAASVVPGSGLPIRR